MDRHLEAFPEDWITLSDSFSEGTNVLPHTADFDEAIEKTKTLEVLRNPGRRDAAFEEFAVVLRNPTANLSEVKGWHRDLVREYDRRKEIDAVSIMMYLTDVTETDHCFAIIPESSERLIDLNPLDVPPSAGVDPDRAGGDRRALPRTAIHNARLKQNSSQRRTLQAYYSNRPDQHTNEWTQIPPPHSTRKTTLPCRLGSTRNGT